MSYWPFWAGGLALAIAAVAHNVLLRRSLGVSGKFSNLIDRYTSPRPAMDDAAMLEALRAMTVEEFGDVPESAVQVDEPRPVERIEASDGGFFLGVVIGAVAVALVSGGFVPTLTLHGATFLRTFGEGPLALVPLFFGGTLVGFGTRMAGGCTSGHGLVGVSRLQPPSLIATACFFGAGIAVSFLLEVVR